jgi:hypothetical protein
MTDTHSPPWPDSESLDSMDWRSRVEYAEANARAYKARMDALVERAKHEPNCPVARMRGCITTDLSAAWREAERRGHRIIDLQLYAYTTPHYTVVMDDLRTRAWREPARAQTGPLALCVAMLEAMEPPPPAP